MEWCARRLSTRARQRTIDVNGHLVWIHDPKSNCRLANQPVILDPLQLLLRENYDCEISDSGPFFCHHCIDVDADTRKQAMSNRSFLRSGRRHVHSL